jgi:hypothetical protein
MMGKKQRKEFLSEGVKYDDLVKSRNSIEFVIPANPGSGPGQAPESSHFKMFWTPAFAGVTLQETFCKIIKFDCLQIWSVILKYY